MHGSRSAWLQEGCRVVVVKEKESGVERSRLKDCRRRAGRICRRRSDQAAVRCTRQARVQSACGANGPQVRPFAL